MLREACVNPPDRVFITALAKLLSNLISPPVVSAVFGLIFLCALAALVVFSLRRDSPLLQGMAACSAISLAALGLINNFWLISNHTTSISHAAVFGAYALGLLTGLLSLPLVGIVFWARWLLRKHTLAQLAAGLLVGAAPIILLAGQGWIHA